MELVTEKFPNMGAWRKQVVVWSACYHSCLPGVGGWQPGKYECLHLRQVCGSENPGPKHHGNDSSGSQPGCSSGSARPWSKMPAWWVASSQLAIRLKVQSQDVKNVAIWGNHSATQFPDVKQARVLINHQHVDVYAAVNDTNWLQGDFISVLPLPLLNMWRLKRCIACEQIIQERGAEIIKKRKLSSAMSAAKAACDHMRDWFHGTSQVAAPPLVLSLSARLSGQLGVDGGGVGRLVRRAGGIVFSFSVHVYPASRDWAIVQGLQLDDFAQSSCSWRSPSCRRRRATPWLPASDVQSL